MKLIPFSVIKAAKENDLEAAEKIRKGQDQICGAGESYCRKKYA